MSNFKIIILTDHLSHIQSDSFYDLVNAIYDSKKFKTISIASRGIPDNNIFFNKENTNLIHVENIDKKIHFGYNWGQQLIKTNFNDYDIALLRIDQPISEVFLKKLISKNKNVIFINNPAGMIKTNSKEFLLKFPNAVSNVSLLYKFSDIKKLSLDKEIVIKPIKSYGGKGISRIYKDTAYIENSIVPLEEFKAHINKLIFFDKKVLVMDFLKNIYKGDKRIIIFNGNIIGTFLRIPSNDQWVCNVNQGAKAVSTEIETEELNIIEKINPLLSNEGIILYGIDTIVNNDGQRVLSEINTANVGGFSIIEDLYKKPIYPMLIQYMLEYIFEKKRNII